jgi:hypothetical protein
MTLFAVINKKVRPPMATSTPPRQQFNQQRERASETAQQGYEELRAAAHAWSDYIDVVTSTLWGHRRGQPAAADIIDRWFDMTHHILDAQRQFSKSLLPITISVFNATSRATDDASRATREVAQVTADETARATREAAQVSADETARATREATRTTTTGPGQSSAQQSSAARTDS